MTFGDGRRDMAERQGSLVVEAAEVAPRAKLGAGIVAATMALTLSGLALAGLVGGVPATTISEASPAPPAPPAAAPAEPVSPQRPPPAARSARAPVAIEVTTSGHELTVAGMVVAHRDVTVTVSIADDRNGRIDMADLAVPRAAGVLPPGAYQHFSVTFTVPLGVTIGSVEARASAVDGSTIGSARLLLAGPHVTDGWRVEGGS